MPKHDFLSPKAIANRQKLAGLQRLRWYCQMCQKQCRDENGFKCHMSSDSHLRQMRVFADNPNRYLSEFSREFERGYLETLSHMHGTKRVPANKVYQEYIADKHHIHMNATMWSSLTGFCMYLGRESKAIVDETEKGWFIQYIDRDPKMLARQAQAEQHRLFEVDETERKKRLIESQIKAAEEKIKSDDALPEEIETMHSLIRSDEENNKVAITLMKNPNASTNNLKKRGFGMINVFGEDNETTGSDLETDKLDDNEMKFEDIKPAKTLSFIPNSTKSFISKSSSIETKAKPSSIEAKELNPKSHENDFSKQTIDKVMKTDVKQEDLISSHPTWLMEGIMVKIMIKKIYDGKFCKKKGKVVKVFNDQKAEVEVEGNIIMFNEKDLETVIPKVDGTVLILKGKHKGRLATILQINQDDYNCDLRLLSESRSHETMKSSKIEEEILNGVDYEDISKYSNGIVEES